MEVVTVLYFLLLFFKDIYSGTLLGIKIHNNFINREDDVIVVSAYTLVKITLYGTNIGKQCQKVLLTNVEGTVETPCPYHKVTNKPMNFTSNELHSVEIETFVTKDGMTFFCLQCNGDWTHQGTEKVKSFRVYKSYFAIPKWMIYVVLIILFCLSALFSALNISLMIFQPSMLKFIQMSGNEKEKRFAKQIYPVRKLGNILLCTILLSNVMVNSTITIIIDKLTSNNYLATLSITTLCIVIFGEIFPQAFGSRHGLALSAYSIWITIIFICLTIVLAYPIGKLLNLILGKEIRQYYNKDKLKLLIMEQEKLGCVFKDEMEIISGALALTEKTVLDVMTPIDNAYMLNYNSTLDYPTMKEIVTNGYTRIPVYDNDKNNIKGILNIKDLTFIDPQDNIAVSTVCTFYNRQILVVSSTTRLPDLLDEFKQGKAHLAFVEKQILIDDDAPRKMLVGLLTLEDVIEEIIQDEIVDETDTFTDNTWKRKLLNHNVRLSMFNQSTVKHIRLSPQLYEAVYQYMSTKINSFNNKYVKSSVLRSLLSSNIVVNHSHNSGKKNTNDLIKVGSLINSAILIIQGKVLVKTNSENLIFEGGPFMFFGESVLENINNYLKKEKDHKKISFNNQLTFSKCKFLPDYTITSMTDLQYLCISAAQYLHARHLTNDTSVKDLDFFKSEKYYLEWNNLREIQVETL